MLMIENNKYVHYCIYHDYDFIHFECATHRDATHRDATHRDATHPNQ